MGLLDEAIREHLELKRRRGADPTEIEHLEQEALGPVRPVAQEGADDIAEYEDVDAPLPEEAAGGEVGHEAEFEQEADWVDDDDLEPDEKPPAGYAEPQSEPATELMGTHGVVPPPEPAVEDEPLPEPDSPPRGLAHDPGVETAEYDVEAELDDEAEDGEEKAEDVLKETPEFLQDAPDHDRLWFEQRPPKDFDFDG
ncbi:MAG: hypothetical protein ACJ764_09485 [Solirubrobacteraceae bacterium]